MKTLVKIILSSIFLILLNLSNIYSQSNVQIKILDNPYPGYLNFDIDFKPGFLKVDNSGFFVGSESVSQVSGFFKVLKNGNIAQFAGDFYYIYNKNMQKVDSIANPTTNELDFHDFIQLQNGNYLLLLIELIEKDMSSIVQGGKPDAVIQNNKLVETNSNGNIIWTWSAMDHYNLLDVTSDIDLTQKVIDFTHINSLDEDQNGNILVSVRHLDEISLINKSTGDFIWRLGGSKCKNNQFSFLNDATNGFAGFSHQHTAEFLENGNILIYDNGNLRSPQYSRAVEYNLNASEKTVFKTWEYKNSPEKYNHAMGSALRLPNGNTLISWSVGSATEVRPDKTKALEIEFPTSFPVYRLNKVYSNLNFARRNLNTIGEFDFNETNNETGIKINILNFAVSSILNVQKHNYSPNLPQYNDSIFSEILPVRWVFHPDESNFSISGIFKVKVPSLNGNFNPNKLVIYKRDKEGGGAFSLLNTTYNSSTNEISANFSGFGEFAIGLATLTSPVLASPVNNSYISNNVILKWNKVAGASNYLVQISKDLNFAGNSTQSNQTNLLQLNFNNLDYSSKYYWRVRSMNIKDTSAWSSVYSFLTEIPKPVLTYPPDNKIGLKLVDSLKWNSVVGADNYQIQISSTINFTANEFDYKLITKNELAVKSLNSNATYYWRVRAFKGTDSSSWSNINKFTTTLSTPILFNPLNEQINVANSSKFIWSYVNGFESYRIQISTTYDFSIINKDINKVQNNEVYVDELSSNTLYYWRVKSIRSTDSSEWSDIFQFFTALDSPLLIFPAINQSNVVVNPELSWKTNKIYSYNLQVSLLNDFSNLIIDTTGIKITKFQIGELKPNFAYYWRVKVIDGPRESKWSEGGYFTTNSAGKFLTPPKQLSPERNSDIDKPIDFIWNRREGAVAYRLQISKSNDFVQNIEDISGLTKITIQLNNFDESSEYYWRIKAYSKYDSSAWSDIWNFKVININEKVTLIEPINDELQVPVIGRIMWKTISEIDFYNVQISLDKSFNDVFENKDVYDRNYLDYITLNYNKTYYWRVRFSKNGQISDWSDEWSFTTSTPIVLATPTILSPSPNSMTVPIEGEIKWTAVEGAKSYMISISTKDNFNTYFFKVNNLKETKVKYSELEYGTVYYIKVSAFNDSSSSLWSTPFVFLTELESPKILSPINKALNVALTGKIQWNVKNDLYFYHIQIDTTNDFDFPIIDKKDFDDLNYEYNLEEGKTYFVRVKSYNDTNYSLWSNIIKFTTLSNSTSVVNEFDNFKINFYPNPAFNVINIEQNDLVEPTEIAIYNLVGELQINSIIVQGNNKIDISKLSNGIYFIMLNKQYYKFIKE